MLKTRKQEHQQLNTLWNKISDALSGKDMAKDKATKKTEKPKKSGGKHKQEVRHDHELLQVSERTDKTKGNKGEKGAKLDQATIIENINERQDELDFEKKKMEEYVKTKKASKELRHLKQVQAKSERQIAKAVTAYEDNKVAPAHHAESVHKQPVTTKIKAQHLASSKVKSKEVEKTEEKELLKKEVKEIVRHQAKEEVTDHKMKDYIKNLKSVRKEDHEASKPIAQKVHQKAEDEMFARVVKEMKDESVSEGKRILESIHIGDDDPD